jgi:hypothetical protein
MNDAARNDAARQEVLAKLAQSRAEIRRLLEPPRDGAPGAGPTPSGATGEFPRSRTMQMLMSGRGLGTVGAILGGLLIARPALALRLVRMLPIGAVARVLLLRAIAGMRAKHEAQPEATRE